MNVQLPKNFKKNTLALCAALSMVGCMTAPPEIGLAAPYAAKQVSPITILPIDRAKFAAGQKFDFLIEVKNADTGTIQATIDGQAADKFFGKAPKIEKNGSISTYRIDQVSFPRSGNFRVAVQTGGYARQVDYTVVQDRSAKRAKNVILLVGDGMSLQARQMARIMSKGITEGKYGDLLEMEKMPHMALVTTSGYDSLVTDSANSASAYATGQKGAVNALGTYSDSTPDPFDDPKVENITELVKRARNMAVGLVSTANITDATPAAMVAHIRKRGEQNFIAETMLDPSHRPDVILGGGSRHFLPRRAAGSKRKDDINLIDRFKALGYQYSGTKRELDATPKDATKLLGLYHLDNMNVYIDRAIQKDPQVLENFNDQPGLADMTKKAVDALKKNPNGFFLLAEGASIDKQLHAMDWQRAAYDTVELDQAVGVAREFAKQNDDTLVIVVADHAHGASITGTYHENDGKSGRDGVRTYQYAGFPTFEDKDGDGYPENPDPDITLAVQYANHPDANVDYKFKPTPISPTITVDGKAIANPKTSGEFYPGNIPGDEASEVHAADDVILNAEGPGSDYFNGVMDNTEIFFGMVRALGLDAAKNT